MIITNEDDLMYAVETLGKDCIVECTQPGSNDEAVKKWAKKLSIVIDREWAIEYLISFGFDSEIRLETNEGLSEAVLWNCCHIALDSEDF